MNTPLDTDQELLDLVRRADPLRDTEVDTDAATDTEYAWRLLAREFDHASAPRKPRRRRALHVVVLAGTVAAAAFVVANVISSNGPAVSPAQARTLIKRASDALLFGPGAIVEEDAVSSVTASDGSTSTSEAHLWLSTSPPYNNRQIIIQGGKVQWEQATVDGKMDLYDPATNTVYLPPASAPQLVPDDPNYTTALAEVRYLLTQPNVTVDPNAVLNGAPAIEFTFDGGRFSYWASPNDYKPLQSEDRQGRLPDGKSGVGISRYPIDSVLTGTSASPSLLSLEDQHPDASVDQSSADYQAALSRLGLAPPPA